jgi:hypothetical protein
VPHQKLTSVVQVLPHWTPLEWTSSTQHTCRAGNSSQGTACLDTCVLLAGYHGGAVQACARAALVHRFVAVHAGRPCEHTPDRARSQHSASPTYMPTLAAWIAAVSRSCVASSS